MYSLKNSRIINENNMIIIKPERKSLFMAFFQLMLSIFFFWVLVQFSDSLHFFFLTGVFLLLLFFGGLAVLGMIYSIWGSKAIINCNIKKIIWQQGLFGLGIGTEKVLNFNKIKNVEVYIDSDQKYNRHNFVLIEINIIDKLNKKKNIIAEFSQIAQFEKFSKQIHQIAEEIALAIDCKVISEKVNYIK